MLIIATCINKRVISKTTEVAPYVRMALRKAKGSRATVNDWKRIIEEFDRKGEGIN